MTTPAPIRQAEIERMMRAVRKVNRCEAVGVEIVNGTLRAIPVIPAANAQAERVIANRNKLKPASLLEWQEAKREGKALGRP